MTDLATLVSRLSELSRKQRERIEELESLLQDALCPNYCIRGVIYIGSFPPKMEPCQFCYERKLLLEQPKGEGEDDKEER